MNKYQCQAEDEMNFYGCSGCVQALLERHDRMKEFIKQIIKTEKFSSYDHWCLHFEAKKLLEEIDEENR